MEINTPLWSPSAHDIKQARLTHYMGWLGSERSLHFHGYQDLWVWSVDHPEEFWESLLSYFNILYEGQYQSVLKQPSMPDQQWFEGIRLNYAEHIFRNETDQCPALVFGSEKGMGGEMQWVELREKTASLQAFFKEEGIKLGDCVVTYLPCIPEATLSLLACSSLGILYAGCSPDFGMSSVLDRFGTITPLVLIAATHYTYQGKTYDKSDVILGLAKNLPSIQTVVLISPEGCHLEIPEKKVVEWGTIMSSKNKSLTFTRVPFNHPLWVLFSSGTTGLPKAIVHSQGGILMEQLKYLSFHQDIHPGERCFWYTTTGWMMWNYIQGSLLCGGVMVLYDGSPSWPNMETLWRFIDETGIVHFGVSAAFILACMKASIQPGKLADLSTLRSMGSTGSTLPPEGFEWVYREVKRNVWLTSISGGTDICSAFVGGNPLWPVRRGEIQCRALGCKVEAWDSQGKQMEDNVGEMVVTVPMPSMPIFFWNDPGKSKYLESYFSTYPGMWRHGDWIKITSNQGIVIYGRSDATLNRGGVRIGTSEIYRALESIDEVKDGLIVCIEQPGGEFFMPLFVVMKEGLILDEGLKKRINQTIRQQFSPRHVPDEIIQAPDIPYTISGKKTELPVKKVLMGEEMEKAVNAGSLKNPQSMAFFVALSKSLKQG